MWFDSQYAQQSGKAPAVSFKKFFFVRENWWCWLGWVWSRIHFGSRWKSECRQVKQEANRGLMRTAWSWRPLWESIHGMVRLPRPDRQIETENPQEHDGGDTWEEERRMLCPADTDLSLVNRLQWFSSKTVRGWIFWHFLHLQYALT